LAIGALLALIVAISVAYRPTASGLEKRSLELGAATTTLVVDTQRSSLLDLSLDLGQLSSRTTIYAAVASSDPVLDLVAREIDVPRDAIVVAKEATGEQEADQRADAILKEDDVYRVALGTVKEQPIMNIATQAPTPAAAVKLANGTARALRSYVASQQDLQQVPLGRRVTVRQLGTAEGGLINAGANLAAAVMSGLVTFVAICLLILFGDRVRIDLRRMRGGAYSPPPPASRLVEVPEDTRRQGVGAEAWGADLDSDPVGDRPKSGTRA